MQLRERATKGLGCQGLLAQAVLSTEKWLALSPPGVAGQGKAGDTDRRQGGGWCRGGRGAAQTLRVWSVLVMQGTIAAA